MDLFESGKSRQGAKFISKDSFYRFSLGLSQSLFAEILSENLRLSI
jgi:hypothetical protein